MTEHAAFLRAIATDPADDTARLAFADWLDEHGDADLAEFIRLQIQLGRHHRGSPRVGKRAAREKTLLDSHRSEWLGPLADVEHESMDGFVFRRGFVDAATLPGRVIPPVRDDLARHCPALTELTVVGLRGHGAGIAGGAFLNTVRTLRVEDLPCPADVAALVDSEHLTRLERLSLWLGDGEGALPDILAPLRGVPSLRRVELVQLHGGLFTGRAAELAANADRIAARIDAVLGRPVAVVERPFDDPFPLSEDVGRNMHGGKLPDGRQVLVVAWQSFDLLIFDSEGRLLEGRRIDLSNELVTRATHGSLHYDPNALFAVLAQRMGFVPGMIWVREFDASDVIPNHAVSLYKFGGSATEVIVGPALHGPSNQEWEEELSSVRFWLHSDNFCITAADECWLDSRGVTHTT